MQRILLKSKIHRATVTGAELHYEGSIALPRTLIDRANLMEFEQVDILNVNNGERFTTYVIDGVEAPDITVNGPAARLVQVGDIIIICAYAMFDEDGAKGHMPVILQMGG
jgi:aspartate 1-decarboxylase